jgi:DNA-binding phage protein
MDTRQIEKLLKIANLSALSKEVGLGRKTLIKVRKGNTNVSPHTILKLAEYFKLLITHQKQKD